jgi:hypothetical protein
VRRPRRSARHSPSPPRAPPRRRDGSNEVQVEFEQSFQVQQQPFKERSELVEQVKVVVEQVKVVVERVAGLLEQVEGEAGVRRLRRR